MNFNVNDIPDINDHIYKWILSILLTALLGAVITATYGAITVIGDLKVEFARLSTRSAQLEASIIIATDQLHVIHDSMTRQEIRIEVNKNRLENLVKEMDKHAKD